MTLLNDLSAGIEALVVEMRMFRRRSEFPIDDIWKTLLQLQPWLQARSFWAQYKGLVSGSHSEERVRCRLCRTTNLLVYAVRGKKRSLGVEEMQYVGLNRNTMRSPLLIQAEVARGKGKTER
jgi:LSD1 subclass zinc finger protein